MNFKFLACADNCADCSRAGAYACDTCADGFRLSGSSCVGEYNRCWIENLDKWA